MAENQNENNIDELLNDIALEPDNGDSTKENNDTIPVNEEDRVQDEFHDDELKIEPDDSLEIDETQETQEPTETPESDDEIDEDLLDDKEYAVQKKQTKLQKILIGVAAGLLVIIIGGIIAYFLGVFDPEEVKEEKPKMEVEQVTPAQPRVDFNDKDINVDRLNKKLNMLTKYEIIEDAKKEEEKAAEKERLHQEAQRKLEEERLAKIRRLQELEEKRLQEEKDAIKREEELLNKQKEEAAAAKAMEEAKMKEVEEEVITVTKENKDITISYETEPMKEEAQEEIKEEMTVEKEPMVPEVEVVEMEEPKMEEPMPMPEPETMMEEEKEDVLENNFIKFIVITTNKRDIYKKDLDKVTSVDSNVKLCRDDSNNIEIFVGPFEDDQRDIKLAVFKYAMKNANIEAVDFTEEEFDKRCNY